MSASVTILVITYNSNNHIEIIYPDGEKVSYDYNPGGQLDHVCGYKSYGYDYVNKIGYDKFDQRYTYNRERHRLQYLAVTSSVGTIMDNAYSYLTTR